MVGRKQILRPLRVRQHLLLLETCLSCQEKKMERKTQTIETHTPHKGREGLLFNRLPSRDAGNLLKQPVYQTKQKTPEQIKEPSRSKKILKFIIIFEFFNT